MLLLVRTLHILAAIWLTAGIIGLLTAHLALRRSEDLGAVDGLVKLMGRFRNFMVRPGGGLLVIFGLWTAYYEAWPRFSIEAIVLLVVFVPFMVLMMGGLQKIEVARTKALQTGSITPALRDAMHNRRMAIGDFGVGTVVLLIMLLMLIKPA